MTNSDKRLVLSCYITYVSSDLSAWPLNLLEYNAYVPRSTTTIQSFVCFYITQG